jgi:serine/threonine-protein kinase
VRSIGIQIAQALAAAHAAGILHRDVKPANILAAAGGMWKLADFGIARLPGSKLTITGQFLGSPSYAAPEALLAGVSSEATDVYSLGATLYEALVGEPPRGHRSADALLATLRTPPTPLRDRLAVPPSLEAAIMAALAVDPDARPTAADFARRLAQGTPRPRAAHVVELAATVVEVPPRRPRYGRAALAAGLAFLALAGIAGRGSPTQWERAAATAHGAAR